MFDLFGGIRDAFWCYICGLDLHQSSCCPWTSCLVGGLWGQVDVPSFDPIASNVKAQNIFEPKFKNKHRQSTAKLIDLQTTRHPQANSRACNIIIHILTIPTSLTKDTAPFSTTCFYQLCFGSRTPR